MAEPHVLRSESGGILELVFNRPEKLNALTTDMFIAVRQAVDDLRNRDDLRVLLIRAVGRYFCAGVDLTERGPDLNGSPAAARRWMRVDLKAGMHSLYEEMERVEKPIVVAHQATCVGGGLEMSLSCDFRLAAESASYSFPELHFGMLPLSGGISRLTRIVGPHWARWMVMANQPVSAERAITMGLIHEIYPDETFEQDVRAFCERLAGWPYEAVAASKLAIELAADLPSDQSRSVERLTYSSLTMTRESGQLRDELISRLRGK